MRTLRILLLVGLSVLGGCGALSRVVHWPGTGGTSVSKATALTKLNLNLRKGPGMGHRILTTLPRGTRVEIVGERGSWRRVETKLKNKRYDGWVSDKYLKKDKSPPPPERVAAAKVPEPAGQVPIEPPRAREPEAAPREPEEKLASRKPAPEAPAKPPVAHEPERPKPVAREAEEAMVAALPAAQPTPSLPAPSIVESTGYAAALKPLRDALAQGKFKEVEYHFARIESQARKKHVGVFPLLERGAVEIDRGRVAQAADTFASAETLLVSAKSGEPERSGGFPVFGRLLSSRSEDVATAEADPLERVWLLDYHALALLLAGDPEAAAIADRAIAAQAEEEKRFAESKGALERELSDAREEAGDELAQAVRAAIERESRESAARAKKVVSSPFANPFAHYVAAITEELRARKDPQLRASARAHYAKALELNPRCELCREAVDDLAENGEAADDRLVHVLVAEGFAPEKAVLRTTIADRGRTIDARLPVAMPVPSPFGAAALAVDPGEDPVLLSEIVDVEAMRLRYEEENTARRELAMLRTATSREPPPADTTSWMTLPARFYAARLRLPKQAVKVAIGTFDAANSRIGGTTVVLDPSADMLIYVRSAGPILSTHATGPDWFSGTTATASADWLLTTE